LLILLVDDNGELLYSLKRVLEGEGFTVAIAENVESAREILEEQNVSLMVLDWILKEESGVDFLKELRKDGYSLPVLMLSSKSEAFDKARALNEGADDYLHKPFSNLELIARIRALLRRDSTTKSAVIEIGGVRIDSISREVFVDGEEINLSPKEFELLEFLMQNAGRVLTRFQIMEHLSRDFDFRGSNIVDAHIKNLRKKIKKDIIKTVRGVGYTLKRV